MHDARDRTHAVQILSAGWTVKFCMMTWTLFEPLTPAPSLSNNCPFSKKLKIISLQVYVERTWIPFRIPKTRSFMTYFSVFCSLRRACEQTHESAWTECAFTRLSFLGFW
jgi:hypothetical protein